MTWLLPILARTILTLLTLLTAIALAGYFLVLQVSPSVAVNSAQQVDDAETVQQLLRELKGVYQSPVGQHEMLITRQQMESLLGFTQRAHPQFSGQSYLQPQRLTLYASYRLPWDLSRPYLNVTLRIPAGQYVTIEQLQLGKLTLPGNALLDIATYLTDWYTESKVATIARATPQDIAISANALNFRLVAMQQLSAQIKQAKDYLVSNENQQLQVRIEYYLDYLQQVPYRQFTGVSLSQYLTFLFQEVSYQSRQQPAKLENEAAILALSIFAADRNFTSLLGLPYRDVKQIVAGNYRPVLGGRHDLSLHFLFSATIHILADVGISGAIGEFKELMDRNSTGTGYSFVDLAADEAGIQFAKFLLAEKTARIAQTRLAQTDDESLFFPTIEDLPEGLSKAAFTAEFEAVDSPAYQALRQDILQRVKRLPLYR